MSDWPMQIPYDLQLGFENNRNDGWRMTLLKWAMYHGLELKIQWFRGLEIAMAELRDQNLDASPADHWHIIRLWLKLYNVMPPDRVICSSKTGRNG